MRSNPAESRTILLSIKPRFVDLIMSGAKTVELRRVRPQMLTPIAALIYASSPTKSLVATATITAVQTLPPAELWSQVKDRTGSDQASYDKYFSGADMATALTIADLEPLEPVSLDELRFRRKGFRPPQSYRFLTEAEANTLVGNAP